ncbi:MAG: hypothetical protein WCE68_05835 [Anaerolineales bacterium]
MLSIGNSVHRVLLINSPAFDTRLPWASWHQPVGLIKIGAWLRANRVDVRMIDCLQLTSGNRLPKQKQRKVTIENSKIDFWRIGLSSQEIISRILYWHKDGWSPDLVLISNGMTFWWEATREIIQVLKSQFDLPIYLGGAYPTYYYDHALCNSGADVVIKGNVIEALNYNTDLTLYEKHFPSFAAIQFVGVEKDDFIADIQLKFQSGIKTFILFDDYIGIEQQELFEETLAKITELRLTGLKFIAPGNLSPRVINRRIANYLKTLNFQHVFLHDDIFHSLTQIEYHSNWLDYQNCIQFLHEAGFHRRTDEIGAAVLIGLPHENLGELTQRIIKLASIAGSVHLVPYQFTPGTPDGAHYEMWLAERDGNYDLTNLNGRFFPLARLAGKSFEDYLELTRLVALLNSKFHSQTFDFLGDTLTASMARKGLSEGLWDPFRNQEISQPAALSIDVVKNDS